jgi:hypothetical protein
MKAKHFLILLLLVSSCTSKKESATPDNVVWDPIQDYYITTNLKGNSTLTIITRIDLTPFVQDYEPAKLLSIKAVLDQGPTVFDRTNLIIKPVQNGVLTNRTILQNEFDSLKRIIRVHQKELENLKDSFNRKKAF